MKKTFLSILLLFCFFNISFSQVITENSKENLPPQQSNSGTPVFFEEKELLRIYSPLGPFTAEDRAQAISHRLQKIRDLKTFNIDELQIIKAELTTDIVYKSETILSITPSDCEESGLILHIKFSVL